MNPLYPRLFRNVVFPSLDLVNRTRIGAVLTFLEQCESWTREQLEDLQRQKLQSMLSRVRDHSSFYREHWKSAPDDRRPGSIHAELDGLPVVTKEELRQASSAFPLSCLRGRSFQVRTSGSTGLPMTFLRSAEQESWFWALRIRMWKWAGYQLGEPYMALNLNQRDAWKKKLQDHLFRCTYLTFNADNQDSRHIVDCLRRRGIVHINAFSSTLLVLAQYMQSHGIENPGVRVLTGTGDNLFPPQRELIENAFGVGICDYYGAGGEGVHLASQCQELGRFHIHLENAVTEVIKNGRPAKPGEVGTIVVTQLDNDAMPLVRYDLGDLARVTDDQPCACGRPHPATIDEIHGRACDLIRTPKGTVLLPQFFFIGPFKMLEGIERYQVVQDQLDGVRIKLVEGEGCERSRYEDILGEYVNDMAEGSLRIDFEWVDEIPLASSGKPRPVVSNLNPTSLTTTMAP